MAKKPLNKMESARYVRVWDSAYASEVDSLSSRKYCTSASRLMEEAGRAISQTTRGFIKDQQIKDAQIVILAGHGNNGGDGFVAARLLFEKGLAVRLLHLEGKNRSPLCEKQFQEVQQLKIPFLADLNDLSPSVWREAIILDALLGIGFKPPLKPKIKKFLRSIQRLRPRAVIAVDTPSGLNVDDGSQKSVPLPADVTLTFGNIKPALILAPARDLCGNIQIAPLSFPHKAQREAETKNPGWLYCSEKNAWLQNHPARNLSKSAHKFDRGLVLVIGGSRGKIGAPALSAMAALRSGAGWATLALPRFEFKNSPTRIPADLTLEDLFLNTHCVNAKRLRAYLDSRPVKAIVIGPGCVKNPLNSSSLNVLQTYQKSCGAFIVFDAAATSGIFDLLKQTKPFDPRRTLMTPHPGEWLRLKNSKPSVGAPLNAASIARAQLLSKRYGVTFVYKSSTPVIVSPEKSIVCDFSDNKIAKAGTGDLIAGMSAAFGALQCPSEEAFQYALAYLSVAAERAQKRVGSQGVTPSGLLEHLFVQ